MQFGVAEAIEHWARYRPAAIAAYANGASQTYAELNRSAAAIASQIEKLSGGETRVAVTTSSKLPLLAAVVGVLRAGRSVVVLNAGLPNETLRINVADAAVNALICDDAESRIRELVHPSPVISISGSPDQATPSVLIRRNPEDEWGVLYSSGTTGVPKGIERSQESIVTELVGWCLELGLNRKTVFYVGRPIYYTGGLLLTLATLLAGGTAVVNDYNDASVDDAWKDYQATLQRHAIDWAFFVPDQLRAFLKGVGHGERQLTARTVLTMGAPITAAEKRQFADTFTCDVVESWGNSESLGTITDPDDIHVRPDSIGRPFLTDEMCVVNDECSPLGPMERGRLAGSESAGFLRYCNRPIETASAKRDSLIISEDIGYTDNAGFFYLSGRSQDLALLPNGETVFTPELESAIRELPAVQDCTVVVSNGKAVARVLVAAVAKCGGSDEVLQRAILERLAAAGVTLAEIRVMPELPRVPSGKVDRIAIQRCFDDGGI
jgi:fatty-acyl-CoA synthase